MGAWNASEHPAMRGTALPTTKTCSIPNVDSAEVGNPADTAALVPGFSGINPFSNIHIRAHVSNMGLEDVFPSVGNLEVNHPLNFSRRDEICILLYFGACILLAGLFSTLVF